MFCYLIVYFRNIGVLSEGYTVYAIDLLGFGDSDKPEGFAYTMEVWSQVCYLLLTLLSISMW